MIKLRDTQFYTLDEMFCSVDERFQTDEDEINMWWSRQKR